MSDDGSINVRLNGAMLPDTDLLREKEFQKLRERNAPVAEVVLTMSNGARIAVETLLNRSGHGWTQFLYLENPAELQEAAETLRMNATGTPAWVEAEKKLRALMES